MSCDARIRPFPVGNDTEIGCEETAKPIHHWHHGTLRDYAYPGSETLVDWAEDDRRNFHGVWPGRCQQVDSCTLPTGHHGGCAP